VGFDSQPLFYAWHQKARYYSGSHRAGGGWGAYLALNGQFSPIIALTLWGYSGFIEYTHLGSARFFCFCRMDVVLMWKAIGLFMCNSDLCTERGGFKMKTTSTILNPGVLRLLVFSVITANLLVNCSSADTISTDVGNGADTYIASVQWSNTSFGGGGAYMAKARC